MDALLPSASNYKINVQVNNITLDVCSYVASSDIIRPFFEDPVSNDQDVTGLIVFLRNPGGAVMGHRVLYSLESSQDDDEAVNDGIIISVKTFDDLLPPYPIPENLPPGMYTMVSQIMHGKNILQRIEKSFYYLNSTDFSYNGINAYLPGIIESAQLIPRGTIVMLEANVDFADTIDPYIIWYEGINKISEGNFSDGAGQLFWKAPEQNSFFNLRADVFPVKTNDRLAGYRKDISLLVSSFADDVNLIADNIQQLIHWYTFEGNLNDSKMIASAERALIPAAGNTPKWMGLNGTYGLVTGHGNIISLPKVKIPENSAANTWQALFRFNPVNDGEIFSALFGSSGNARLQLFKEGLDIILTLSSSQKTVSQTYSFPEESDEPDQSSSFLAAGINFSILPDSLSAHINFLSGFSDNELNEYPAVININIEDEFQIVFGFSDSDLNSDEAETRTKSAVIWDEFALYYMPPGFFTAGTTVLAAGEEP